MREHTITATRNPSSKSPRPRAIGHMPWSSSRSIRFHALLWPVGEIATLVSAARQAENTRGRGYRLTSGRDVVDLAGSRGSSTPPSSDPRLGHVSVLCRRDSSPIPCSVCCVFSASDHAARARSVRGRGTPSDHEQRTPSIPRRSAARVCPPCHAQTDAPYARGRLIITPLGDGRFTCEVTRGADKWAVRA